MIASVPASKPVPAPQRQQGIQAGQPTGNRQVTNWATSKKISVSLSTYLSFVARCRPGGSPIVVYSRRAGAGAGLLERARFKAGGSVLNGVV